MTLTDDIQPELTPWWHPHNLSIGETWHCAVGPLSLYLQRREWEWALAWERKEEFDERGKTISESLAELPEALTVSRYVFSETPPAFVLKPTLLERPLVVKTRQPVRVPPGQHVTFYISAPVRVSVELEEPSLNLDIIPSLALSDTWFGPNTREGDLCFSARTHARNNRAELPLRPHRAVTPVAIHNHSTQILTIDKLSIPLPLLSTYGGSDGALWTNAISLTHTEDNPLAQLDIGPQPEGLDLITPAQEAIQRDGFVRAFTSFFSD